MKDTSQSMPLMSSVNTMATNCDKCRDSGIYMIRAKRLNNVIRVIIFKQPMVMHIPKRCTCKAKPDRMKWEKAYAGEFA